MSELDHARGAVFVHSVGQPLNPRDDRIVVCVQIPECEARTVLGHNSRAGGHGQRHTTLRLFFVVEAVAIRRHRHSRQYAGSWADEKIRLRSVEVLQLERFEQRIGRAHEGQPKGARHICVMSARYFVGTAYGTLHNVYFRRS